MNKYGAQKITVNGVTFDSKKEAYRWHELKILERGKVIKDLKPSEIGEIHGLYQKTYQGHELHSSHVKKELGDLLWFIAEYCTACGWQLEDVAQMNIDKLRARYPEGFDTERSLHRAEGDV